MSYAVWRRSSVAVAVTVATGSGVLVLRLVDDERVGREDHRRDGLGVAQRGAGDLDRVDDTGRDEVAVLARGRVEALAERQLGHLGGDDVALQAGVLGDPAQRLGDGLAHDGRARGLVTGQLEGVDGRSGVDEGGAATGDDALLDRGPRRGDGVLDAVLLLLELDLGVRADLDDADAAGELGETLLELLAVPVGVGALDLGLDLVDAAGDLALLAVAVDDRRVVLGEDDAAGLAEDGQVGLVEAEPDLRRDDLATGEDGDVLEHGLAAVPEAGSLDGRDVERATDLVDHEGREGLAVDVLGNDEQGLARLHDLLEDREDLGDRGDLALVDEDVGVLEDGLHALGVGDEVGREVALVELHALGELELGRRRRGLLDGDDAVLADLVERLADEATEGGVLGRERGDGGDLVLAVDLAGVLEEAVVDCGDSLVHAALERGRSGTGGDVAQALLDHGLGEHGRGRRAVTGDVVGLGRDLLGELGAEVLVGVLELDLAGDGHAVVRDRGGAPLLVDDDVAALRAERHLDGVGERVDAALERLAGGVVELQLLGHGLPLARVAFGSGVAVERDAPRGDPSGGSPGCAHGIRLGQPTMARTSRAERIRNSSPPYLTSVPPYLLKMTLSPTLTSSGTRSVPLSLKRPGPTATTSPSWGFSLAVSGMTRPEAVVCSASRGLTPLRSSRGLMLTDTMSTSTFH